MQVLATFAVKSEEYALQRADQSLQDGRTDGVWTRDEDRQIANENKQVHRDRRTTTTARDFPALSPRLYTKALKLGHQITPSVWNSLHDKVDCNLQLIQTGGVKPFDAHYIDISVQI